MLKLILIRGLPGSGKSTLAKSFNDFKHFEADMFFTLDTGDYVFDASKLSIAHQWCQNKTKMNLSVGNNVVVSNTFTTLKELRPYFEIAKEFNIIPFVITIQGCFGSIHNVPEETMIKMKQRFVHDISPLHKEFFL